MKKEIATVAAIAVISTSSFAMYNHFNTKDNKEIILEQLQDKEYEIKDTTNTVDIYFDQINETNIELVEITLFESDLATFKMKLEEDTFINPIEITSEIKYSYKVGMDLRSMNVKKGDNNIIITINKSQMYISSIETKTPKLDSDINFFNQFKGKTIQAINKEILNKSYDSIENIVKLDFKDREERIIRNIKSKLSYIYGIEEKYLDVIVEENINE